MPRMSPVQPGSWKAMSPAYDARSGALAIRAGTELRLDATAAFRNLVLKRTIARVLPPTGMVALMRFGERR